MPRGFLTEGPDGRGDEGHPEFAERYGAVELPTAESKARTVRNVRDSDATIWFGDGHSDGGKATLDACRLQGKPFLIVYHGATRPSQVRVWIVAKGIRPPGHPGAEPRLAVPWPGHSVGPPAPAGHAWPGHDAGSVARSWPAAPASGPDRPTPRRPPGWTLAGPRPCPRGSRAWRRTRTRR